MSKIKEVATEKLTNFIMDHMTEYFKFVRKRLEFEVSLSGVMLVFITTEAAKRSVLKKAFLNIFGNFTGKYLCWSLFLIKLQFLRAAILLKRDSNRVVFLWNSRNF